MTLRTQIALAGSNRYLIAAALLAFLLVYYLLAVDNGLLLGLVQGKLAFDQNFIHELVHDARHSAGFPCH